MGAGNRAGNTTIMYAGITEDYWLTRPSVSNSIDPRGVQLPAARTVGNFFIPPVGKHAGTGVSFIKPCYIRLNAATEFDNQRKFL